MMHKGSLILCAAFAHGSSYNEKAFSFRVAPSDYVSTITTLATAKYEKPPCQPDEKAVEVKGVSGDMCAPSCSTDSDCPTDVMPGVNATPKCEGPYCVLICSVDSDCDTAGGAKCQTTHGTGVCTYPAVHYENPPCQPGELSSATAGVSGHWCSPPCTTAPCPTDVPPNVTAAPTCALEDPGSGAKWCALICSADSECDTAGGASCQPIQGTGICTYPEAGTMMSHVFTFLASSSDESALV